MYSWLRNVNVDNHFFFDCLCFNVGQVATQLNVDHLGAVVEIGATDVALFRVTQSFELVSTKLSKLFVPDTGFRIVGVIA